MFEFIPFAALLVSAIIATLVVTSRDGYRRLPRRH
jgi:hypothetical protein